MAHADVDEFIKRWTSREGGAERANYQMFLSELCDLIGVARPEPAGAERGRNDYVFERAVDSALAELGGVKRIDLYKRGAFILEAKQSRLPGAPNAVPVQLSLLGDEPEKLGRRTVRKGWDVLMKNAFNQARQYAQLLPTDHASPPFLVVADVGHCLEIYADFSGTGRGYSQFPDRHRFRIYLEDLRKPEVRTQLAAIWDDPVSLDPTREAVRVTKAIATRLAQISKALEGKHPPEEVAHFLMRCIFTMFAEDVDLLPKGSFTRLLEDCIEGPASFAPLLQDLWAKMDEPEHDRRFYSAFKTYLRHFNGNLFKNARAFPLGREEIGELLAAAKAVWTEVDPAIFGTLLEQALDKDERRKLGAHYTPRAYVERLVGATVMEPLRADWDATQRKAEDAVEAGRRADAVRLLRAFHHQLCTTRVLDPACGTGNFLYVSLELMKKLEGEVLESLAELGEAESMGFETVDPHQFLGLELNPRAAAIAELVVWIGYLQQHYRARSGHPSEPILRAFENINFGRRVGYDSVLTWDGYPLPTVVEKDGRRVEIYPNARRPIWPEAEFIVGNPPFISNRDMRGLLGDCYVDCLKPLYPEFTQAADLVLFFWIRATEKSRSPRRIGFVSTSRIRLKQNNAVLKNALEGRWNIRFALPDHDWPSSQDGASVRVAFTTVDRHAGPSILVYAPDHDMVSGRLKPNGAGYREIIVDHIATTLSAGPDPSGMTDLSASQGLCHAGVKPYSRGLHIDARVREHIFPDAKLRERYAPRIMNGHDVGQSWRGYYIIDVNSLDEEQLRRDFPRAYSYIVENVKPERIKERNPRLRRDYWKFEANRSQMRDALSGLTRYIVTLENSPQRYFTFLPTSVLPDQKLRVVASDDAYHLALLGGSAHTKFSVAFGGRAGKANTPVYNTECFTHFPFPDASEEQKTQLRRLGGELDATRRRVQAEHPDLTLTGLYNVLEKLRTGETLSADNEDVKSRGLVTILKDLHEQIDALIADAYGWPHDLSEEVILERLVTLNAERAAEETADHVRWIRPGYQIPRFARGRSAKTGELELGGPAPQSDRGLPTFPTDRYEQPLAVEAALAARGRAMDANELARAFKGSVKAREQRISQVLATLARYGRVSVLSDGRYAARKTA